MTLATLLAHVAARWAATRTPIHGWVPDESETDMSEHEPHIGDIYASNDRRDIGFGSRQRRTIRTVGTVFVRFDTGTRPLHKRFLDTTAQRGYRLIHCTQEEA